MTKQLLTVGLLAMGFGLTANAQKLAPESKPYLAPWALTADAPSDGIPTLVSTTPEDGSFDLASLSEVVFHFSVPMDTEIYGELTSNGMEITLPSDPVLSEDKLSITVTLPSLKDGEYTVTLYDLLSEDLVEMPNNPSITFALGEDRSEAEIKDIYNPDWTNLENGTFPVGWVSNDNGTIHEYVVMSNGSIGNYNWGGNLGGGGCRAMTGYSGDFNGGAMYWRCMNGDNTLGQLTYGAQVKKYMEDHNGSTEGMDPGIGLWLDADKYHISFKCAAWCQNNEPKPDAVEGDPVSGVFYDPNYAENVDNYWLTYESPIYNFELTDLYGEVFAAFHEIKAIPTVHRSQNIRVTNATENEADFTVTTPGYYVLNFFSTQANAEFLMGGLKLITMPSKAAYYKGILKEAADAADLVCLEHDMEDYEGATLTALKDEIKAAYAAIENCTYHYPSEVETAIKRLYELSNAIIARKANVDVFVQNILDGEFAVDDVIGSKYENAQGVAEAIAVINKYKDVKPSELGDEEIAEVAAAVKDATSLLSHLSANAGVLTWGIYKARQTYGIIGTDAPEVLQMAEDAIVDDRSIANAINKANKVRVLEILANELEDGKIPAKYLTQVNPHEEIINDEETGNTIFDLEGIELTGCIANPKLYRVLGNDGVPGWTIVPGSEESSLNIAFNRTPNEGEPVVDTQINIYGNADYDMSQIVTNLPAGIYTYQFSTRTPLIAGNGNFTTDMIYYNAQDENGTWDKYIYVNNGEMNVTPYTGAGGLTATYVRDVEVGEDGTITVGAHEHYVSGQARAWDAQATDETDARDFWTGTSYATDAHIYLTAPLAGYDYKKALETSISANEAIVTVSGIYNAAGQKVASLQKGINIIKMSNNTVKKIIIR